MFWRTQAELPLQRCLFALLCGASLFACSSNSYPKNDPAAAPQQNALSLRVAADTLRLVTENLEEILKKNLPLDETGEFALIYLPEASDASARVFCDEGNQWPGLVPPCTYNVRLRDGCLGPGEQDANHKCQPDMAGRPRESLKSFIRVRITDLASHIRLEMEDPGVLSTGGFRLIIEDLTLDADISLYAKLPPIFGYSIGDFTCRYRSPDAAMGQAIKVEKIDISIQPRIDTVDGKPVLFATSVARDVRLASLALTAETIADPACLSNADGALDCTQACALMDGAISVVGEGFNFINDLLKPALPYIVTPIANAALAFLWGDALEFGFEIPVSGLDFIPKSAGRNVRILASAQPGSFAVTQKGSGTDDPTRGTGINLTLGAHAELSPCVGTLQPPLGFVSSIPPALDGTLLLTDPTLDPVAGVAPTYEETYHIGLALSEGFFNQMAFALRNSGMLCIALGSDPGGLLANGSFVPNAGLLYLIAPPLAGLAPANAPIFFSMKPGQAPTVRFGSGKLTAIDDKGKPAREPLLTLNLLDTGIEFHLFIAGRYVRTFALNVDIVVGLTIYPTTEGKLMLSIDSIKADNIVEQFNELMPNYDFSGITEVLFSILSTQLSSSSLSFELPIRDALKNVLGNSMSIRLLDVRQEGTARDFLGIYVKLCSAADELDPNNRACAVPLAASPTRELSQIAAVPVQVDHLDGAAMLQVTPPGAGSYEYQSAIDSEVFGAFTAPDAQGLLRIQNPILRVLGKHAVTLRPRVMGQPVDLEARLARTELLVDPESPRVYIEGSGGLRAILAEDLVTPPERLRYQVIDEEREGSWTTRESATAELRGASDAAFVLAQDEAGNISADPRLLEGGSAGAAAPELRGGCANAGPAFWPLLLLACFLRRRSFLRT